MESFPGLRAELEDCVEAPGDKVLAAVGYTGRARASGMEMDWRQWLVYTVDQGLIVRAEEYFKREEALEAAGLSE
jgi:ketosteroid isomerase-like protein